MPLQPKEVEAARLTLGAASARLPHMYGKILELMLVVGDPHKRAQELGLSDQEFHRRYVTALRLLQEQQAVKDSPAARSYTDELITAAEKVTFPANGLAREPEATAITPELLEWARQQFSEEEIVAALQEFEAKGGLELKDFIHELEEIVAKDD